MKKKLATLAMVSVLAVSLVACGKASNNTNTNVDSNKVNVENDSIKNDTESSAVEQSTDIETTDKEENKPDYTVVDVSYTKYTMVSCSIRDYPGVSGEEVGILAINTKVNVIGECNNGWLKISYKDMDAFIRALYLSDAETIIEESTPTETPTPTLTEEPTPTPTETPTPTPEPTPTPHEHSYTETIIQECTCETWGYKLYTCACGYSYEDKYCHGHVRDNIRVVFFEATCTEPENTCEHCIYCGTNMYIEMSAPALGHTPKSYWIYHHGTGTYRLGCANCGVLLDETTEKPEGVEIQDFYPRPVN